MKISRRAIWLSFVLALMVVVASAVSAGPATSAPNSGKDIPIEHAGDVVQNGTLPIAQDAQPSAARRGAALAPGVDPPVGTKRLMPVLDDVNGIYRIREFTLRAIGDHVEIWVQSNEPDAQGVSGTQFLPGDCRNDRTEITDAQLASMVSEFDTNIYPKESAAFSVPPTRDGTNAILTEAGFGDYTGDGDKIVALVSNVRDDNFYSVNNPTGLGYIAGFFSSQVNDFLDRNVMTIDAFDWLHRTGANPPDEPVPGDFCKSAPARPYLYEGTFAHEYQHLLESYEDGDESNWINEGLSDWAQTLTGYVDPSLPITDKGFDSHIQCFLGYLGVQTAANPNPRAGGPENSLTRWGDQGDDEILCDYGAAYTFMEFVHGRYGTDFMTALHRGDANGLAGLQEALGTEAGKKARKTEAQDVLHDWSLMVALDKWIDDGARTRGRPNERDVTAPTLSASVNWEVPDAYATPGAPSNGADYVRLRNAQGRYLTGERIQSLSFSGATTLPTRPVQWTVDASPPGQAGNPALYSGAEDDRDEAIVRQVTVPSGTPSLTFDALWNEEEGWDYGFVQVSTDGGATYVSLACTDTTTETNPDALPTAKDNVPGFTGYSGGFRPQTCSLSAYAGQTVLLAFRAFNDPAFLGQEPTVLPGFWVDDVRIGTTLISDGSSLSGWRSFTEVRPNPVAGFTVYLVSFQERNRDRITVRQLKLTGDFNLRGSTRIRRYIDRNADFVGAIVFYDDPSETSTQYAPYRLGVNGVTQPGGGL